MYAQKEKSKKSKSRSIANSVVQKKGNSKRGLGVVDNRPKSLAQKRVQIKINNSEPIQMMLLSRFIHQSDVSPTRMWLRDTAAGNAIYRQDMEHGIDGADGMSTLLDGAQQAGWMKQRPYRLRIGVNDVPNEYGAHAVNAPAGYYAYHTPAFGGPSHWSINKSNNWDGVADVGMANVDDMIAEKKENISENPQNEDPRIISEAWKEY